MKRQGLVLRYLGSRGYGFVQPDGGGESVFFHHLVFDPSGGPPPITGEKVTYEVPSEVSGVKAEKVVRLEDPIRLTGTVTSYNPVKGYGFVKAGAQGLSYYMHKSEILSRTEPARGSQVDFYAARVPVQGEAPRACYVTVIS